MEPIPVPMECNLDEEALLFQRDRYRRIGAGARLLERSPRRLALRIDADVGDRLIDGAMSVERSCCSFFSLDWRPETRILEISVSSAEHEPALAAILTALEP
jgi:hypothetical protein